LIRSESSLHIVPLRSGISECDLRRDVVGAGGGGGLRVLERLR